MYELIPFILSLLIFLFLIIYYIILSDKLFGDIDTPSSKKVRKKVCEIIKKHHPHAKTFYDMGCSRGAFALAIQKSFPHLKVCGVDNNRWRIFLCKIRAHITKQPVLFTHQDLFTLNLREVDVVYLYLLRSLMPILEKKLLAELKPGAIVIINTGFFPNWKPITYYVINPNHEEFEKIFVYKK